MAESVDNLILQRAREIRTEMSGIRDDVRALRANAEEGFAGLTHRVDGLTVSVTMLAGRVHHIEERVDVLDGGQA